VAARELTAAVVSTDRRHAESVLREADQLVAGAMARASSIRARAISEMRRHSRRPERVSEVIRHAVGVFLTGDVRDPRIGFVTVIGVEVSLTSRMQRAGQRHGTDEEKAKSLEGWRARALPAGAALERAAAAHQSGRLANFHLDRASSTRNASTAC